ncbi:MAG: transcriptional regulator, AraC family [Clostridia bacterium]|jgi:AraC-like DNA-binding protein|uniref:AraC family transcriptional regulator n=1 Tax=Petroclostridium xylanilyticum TaxID=1792311 RepID=UPI000B982312|nr:AraC family transcriptional regulator [Petroclostridium xylanilyticum]MBZ4644560.1 transcriptional regulator, AraC family [Clostridia bacterium]
MAFPIVTDNERKLPFYLIGVGCWYSQEDVIRSDGYPNFQWIQCHRGEGELVLEGKTYTVKEQQGMFLYPNEPHQYYAVKKPWEVDWITFGGSQVESFVRTMGIHQSGVYSVVNGGSILSKMRKALSTVQSDNTLKGLECSAIVYDLLIDLFKFISKNHDDSVQHQYSRLQPVFEYVENNYYKVITLNDLAAAINVTPQYLCFLFKKIMNMRPFEYINNVRINKSKDLLMGKPELEIGDISRLVGYDDVSYFCAVFKKIEGVSPGNFKKLHGVI